jgi:hypothetical protein
VLNGFALLSSFLLLFDHVSFDFDGCPYEVALARPLSSPSVLA